ncbi:FeoA family protein [Lacticaseibacillus suihuaensis]
MQALTDVVTPGTFLIMQVTARPTLARHLAELGLRAGQRLTVIQTSKNAAGMVIFFQGQRLAVSDEIAGQVQVAPLRAVDDAALIALADLPVGDRAVVGRIEGQGQLRQRLLDMGLTRGTLVHLIRVAPMGDPLELAVRGYKLTLRRQDALAVRVERMAAHG